MTSCTVGKLSHMQKSHQDTDPESSDWKVKKKTKKEMKFCRCPKQKVTKSLLFVFLPGR